MCSFPYPLLLYVNLVSNLSCILLLFSSILVYTVVDFVNSRLSSKNWSRGSLDTIVPVFQFRLARNLRHVEMNLLYDGSTSWLGFNKFLSDLRNSLFRQKLSKGFKSELSCRKKPLKGIVDCVVTSFEKTWASAMKIPGRNVLKNDKRIKATVFAIRFSLFNMALASSASTEDVLLQNTPRYEKIITERQITQNRKDRIRPRRIGTSDLHRMCVNNAIVALANQIPHINVDARDLVTCVRYQ